MAEVGVGDLVDGKYRIIRLLGEGGWGIVYEAENARTLRRVALKVLRSRPDAGADIRARFEREAQAAGRIGSDHIVEVFDLGTLDDGTHYMVMQLLHGTDLAKRIAQSGPLDPMVAAKLVLQLLDGLGAAHDAGILHRDLKPENLFLVPTRSGEDFVKILDFGISKFNAADVTSATMTGAVLGSPVYMAPEQARGLKHVDARTDLYSVGVLFYETLTGRVPFMGDNFNDLMFKIALSPRPDPMVLRPDLDSALSAIVVRAIAADPKERFQNTIEFATALVEWMRSKGHLGSIRAPPLQLNVHSTPRGGRHSLSPRLASSGHPPAGDRSFGDVRSSTPGGRGSSPSGPPQGSSPSSDPRSSTPSGEPRISIPVLDARGAPSRTPVQWNEPTLKAEQGLLVGMPPAGAGTLDPLGASRASQGKTRDGGVAVAAIGAVLVALLGVGLTMALRHGPASGPAAAPAPAANAAAAVPSPAPEPSAGAPAAPLETAVLLPPRATVAPTAEPPPPEPEPEPVETAPGAAAGAGSHHAAPSVATHPSRVGRAPPVGPASAAPPPVGPASAAPPPVGPAPAAPPTSAAAPVAHTEAPPPAQPAPAPPPAPAATASSRTLDTVEGRAFRTGL